VSEKGSKWAEKTDAMGGKTRRQKFGGGGGSSVKNEGRGLTLGRGGGGGARNNECKLWVCLVGGGGVCTKKKVTGEGSSFKKGGIDKKVEPTKQKTKKKKKKEKNHERQSTAHSGRGVRFSYSLKSGGEKKRDMRL